MIKALELFIGWRYMLAKRSNHFISFISLSSMLGVAVGVWALIVVISVMNGFESELRTRILSMAAHATVAGSDNKLSDWQVALRQAEQNPEVIGAAPYVHAEAMLTNRGEVRGSIIRGVDPGLEPRVSDVVRDMVQGDLGSLGDGLYHIILGQELARHLGVRVGDKVTLVAPQARVTPAGILPRLRRFTVSGIFAVGMHDYDSALAFIHIKDAARLFRFGDAVSGVRLKLADMMRAPFVSRELANQLSGVYWVTDWTQQHVNFFRAIRTEKTVMFIILTLIVGVAAFNIVSTLIMVVTDKQADIAILRTLGMSPASIMRVFVVQGTFIGTVGTLLGMAVGIVTAVNVQNIVARLENAFGIQFLPADVYYISDLPSELHSGDVLRIGLMAFVLTVVATLYPAWRASRTQPAEALRYE